MGLVGGLLGCALSGTAPINSLLDSTYSDRHATRGSKSKLTLDSCCRICGLDWRTRHRNFAYPRATSAFRVRAKIRRADGRAESSTGRGTDEDGSRSGWSGEQDSQKAKALWDSTIYPVMRVYRDDLCSLEVTGDARARQALEAMSADGGFTASEELSKGRSLMTVETIIPGRWEDHSTISTKLLAPTHLVHKTAKGIWTHKKVSMSSGNALARAFQKVVMQHLLSFDIHIRSPGMVRDMGNLANEKEDGVVATLESREAAVLDGLAEAVCSYSLANVTEDFHRKLYESGRRETKFAFRKEPVWTWSLNKAIGIRSLSESEVFENLQRLLDEGKEFGIVQRTHQAWWPTVSSVISQKGLGQGENDWKFEFIPVHKIQIDRSKVKCSGKGWLVTKSDRVLELCLTHAQLVDLADMLDLYYEDSYTAPAKKLRSGLPLKLAHPSQSKVTRILLTSLLSVLAGGVLLIGLRVISKLRTSHPLNVLKTTPVVSSPFSRSSFTEKWCRVQPDRHPMLPKNNEIDGKEMEAFCVQVVTRVKDAFNLDGEVESSPEKGAWIGADLSELEKGPVVTEKQFDALGAEISSYENGNNDDAGHPISQSLDTEDATESYGASRNLLYQVVLSRTGNVLGFQPGNKPAISQWVLFPFARELHNCQRFRSGLFERSLRYYEPPADVIVIELICSTDTDPPAVTARPWRL